LNEFPIGILVAVLTVLILLSGFFSGSETALMTLNRYRLKNLAEKGHRGARLARRLLRRPDRLLGLILLFNNLVNNAAAAIVGTIAFELYGDIAIAIATFILTLVVLIFAEVAPKTLATLKPELLAFPAAYVYTPMLSFFYPLIWAINFVANGLLSLIGVHPERDRKHSLNAEELRAVVNEAEQFIPLKHSDMLLRILDLEKISVDDVMVPRNDITGIDLNDDWSDIEHQIAHSQRTRVPVFHDNIDNTVGILHLRKVLHLLTKDELNMETLTAQIREPYFIPAATSVTQQLLSFQKKRRRSGLVVDEYGSIQGLVTLEDILEEIVGEFTTDSPVRNLGIHAQDDGSYLIDGNTHIRDINRSLSWSLPYDGPRTLNGLILEKLEMIPKPGTSIMIANHPIEVTRTSKNAVQTARVRNAVKTDATESQYDENED